MDAVCRNRQHCGGVAEIEHLVISDGPDMTVKYLCSHYGARYYHTPEKVGDWGKSPLDIGVQNATGDYILFWDDDNIYTDESASRHFEMSRGFDMGICPILFWERRLRRMLCIPREWNGSFKYGDIDTANVCVRREFLLQSGLTCAGVASGAYGSDFALYAALLAAGATVNYCDKHPVATHI